MQASYSLKGYKVEIVYSGAPGWFDFYIDGNGWGCDRANKIQERVRKAIELKESRKTGGAR
jgi:hypothetical protein